MEKKYEKWFEFRTYGFISKRNPKNLTEAWDKTLKKWELLFENSSIYSGICPASTCGLCNKYHKFTKCKGCCIAKITDDFLCRGTPLSDKELSRKEKAELEYLFLLFVKEATFNNKW